MSFLRTSSRCKPFSKLPCSPRPPTLTHSNTPQHLPTQTTPLRLAEQSYSETSHSLQIQVHIHIADQLNQNTQANPTYKLTPTNTGALGPGGGRGGERRDPFDRTTSLEIRDPLLIRCCASHVDIGVFIEKTLAKGDETCIPMTHLIPRTVRDERCLIDSLYTSGYYCKQVVEIIEFGHSNRRCCSDIRRE